ncbi:MAG: hypothetical protein KKD98_10015, partial [Candidatus Thermoplasmatota archaeon]|nr:hypothetical protein [Candidatus Thermoplasmatota archaeon]
PTSSIVLDNADMSIINSYVGIDWTSAIDNYHAKNAFDLINGANLHLYNMSISEDEGGITGIRDFLEIPVGADPLLDYMPIRVGSDCEAYYYKWLDIEVVDKYGLAVPDAIINSTFYFTNQTVVDMVFEINDLTNTTDSAKVRMTDYLNRVYGVIPAEFNMTGSNGHAMIPLLTTFLNSTNYPNGDHVGEYEVDVNYGTNYSYTPCDFRPFPNIMPADNTVSYQVSLDGLALPRPIGSPGLVVNFNTGDVSIGGSAVEPMTINDFIVVEDSATLTITNANLKLAYSDTAPFEIIVRGQGTLILNNVAMSTQGSTPITITLMDGANLTMTGSRTTSAMNIMAYDDAEIVLDTTVLGGGFGTGPDANVRLWARSTSFAQSITKFTGTSEARLIGCYSPSAAFTIQPTGNAFVWIYRWVAITVNNGLTPPNGLTNAYVWINTTTHPQFAATLNNNGLTNITGVYRVPVISDLINATGSTPYNNYKVDTQYVGYAKTHSKSISLGLPTYSLNEMLQANALAARTVVLENVLPDLAPILTVFPLMANSSIGRGNEILVNATISNIGDATATGIVVWFQDYYDGAPTTMHQEVIQTLASTQFINISFPYTWYLASDVGQHNITVSITPLKEQDTANNKDYVNLNVTSQADLAIRQYSDVWFSDNNPLVDRQFTIYSNVWNLGDANATDVLVSFYELNSGALLGNATVANIPVDSVAVASIPVTFTMNSTYYILVYVDRADAITEVDETNNNNSAWPRQLIVREYPGLAITDFSVVEGTNMANIGLGFGTVIIETSNRTMVTLRARVQNDGEMFASGVYVNFYNGPTLIGRSNTLSTISSGSAAYAMLAMEALTPGLQQIYNLRAIAYESSGLGLTSNEALQTFTVYDNRPDMSIDEIILANNMTQATDGNAFLLNVTISNNGISDAAEFAVEVYASQEDYNATKLMHANGNEQFQGRLNHTLVELLETGDNITLTMRCTSITVGNQTLFIFVDPELNNSDAIDYDGITSLYGDIEEYNELNNNDTYEVPVVMPELRIILQIPAIGNNVFVEGEVESVLITGLVVRADSANIGVEGILVTIIVGDNAPVIVNSSAGGFFSTSVAVTAAGNYTIRAYGDDINEVQSWFRIDTAPSIPWWILIVIALAVVAVIVGIGLYLYFVGLGKTVQCGECSAFIPEGAAKCPKCGVEFETEVAKCSVCGAWVPMDVKNCPDCGTEFTVGTENLDDYEAKMKRQFEDVVRKFRDEAKNDLGQEFTETEFQAWWAKQPTFITFDLWLKEDEEMKRMGSRPCPVCQMENSVTAKICHKCGSVMGEPDTPPKKPEGKLPPAKPEGKMPPVGAKPGEQPKQVPPQQAAAPKPAQQQPQATPQQVPAQQVAPQSAQPSPASQPSSAQPGKKACPSCGMEVNIAEKNCPICNHEFQDKPPEGGDHTRRIIRKPIKKVVRRPMEGGGDQQGGQ